MPAASHLNFTSTNLDASATFVGAWEQPPASSVLITVFSDQAGSVLLEYRRNSSSTVESETIVTPASTQVRQIRFFGKQEFRLSYTNTSVTTTTALEVSAYFGDYPTARNTWNYHEDSSDALTDAVVHAAPGAGLSLYVTNIVISTGAANAFNVFFEEATTTVLGPFYLEAVAGRGAAIELASPKQITANTALTVTSSAAIAHSIDVTGYIDPE